jgi:hypothetical protein
VSAVPQSSLDGEPFIASSHVRLGSQAGQVLSEHVPEQQLPPQQSVSVEQVVPSAPQQVVLEHVPEQHSPPQQSEAVEQVVPSCPQQVVLEHSPEQHSPPQQSVSVEQVVPSCPQQVVLEQRFEQQLPLQQSESSVHSVSVPLHVVGASHTPSVQVAGEQQSPVVHGSPWGMQGMPLEVELGPTGEVELELEAAPPVPPLPPFWMLETS